MFQERVGHRLKADPNQSRRSAFREPPPTKREPIIRLAEYRRTQQLRYSLEREIVPNLQIKWNHEAHSSL